MKIAVEQQRQAGQVREIQPANEESIPCRHCSRSFRVRIGLISHICTYFMDPKYGLICISNSSYVTIDDFSIFYKIRNTVEISLVTEDLPDVTKQIAKALFDLDEHVIIVGMTAYKVTSPLLESLTTGLLEPVVCFLCEQHETCTKDPTHANMWFCRLYDTNFYPFGTAQGDKALPPDIEDAADSIQIVGGIPVGNILIDTFWISVNGIINFKEKFTSFSPSRLPVKNDDDTFRDLMAIYWADLDLTASDRKAHVFYQYYQSNASSSSKNAKVFAKASLDVIMYSQEFSNFTPTDVAIVTWENVPPSPANTSSDERVTFQCVIISDGEGTYVMYKYGQGAMQFNPVYNRPVEVGWRSINLDIRFSYYSFDTILGNTGQIGQWFFKIGETSNSKRKCLQWASENELLLTEITKMNATIPACPCSEIAAIISVFWIPSPEEDGCFDIFPLFENYGRRCCYRQDNSSGFETRIPAAGSLQRYNYFFGDLKKHEQEDVLPKRWCCVESRLCDQFYRLRPANTCQPRTTARGLFFGDPHITTVDNMTYTFNGHGEFILLQVNAFIQGSNRNVNFILQGRTCFANVSISNATAFCALAMKTTSNSTFTVEVSRSGKRLFIFLNGYDYSLQFQKMDNKFQVLKEGMFLQKVNGTLQVCTSDGIGLVITLRDRILDFTIELDTKFKNLTTGLAGNFNGNPKDDFTFPNGSKVTNTSDRSLFNFGWTWAVNEKSVFTYTNGYNTSTYSDRRSIPPFLDETDKTEISEGKSVCLGAYDQSCLYDFFATKDAAFAERTKYTTNGYVEEENTISNNPPVITTNLTLKATVNQSTVLTLTSYDPDDDKQIFFKIIEQPDSRVFQVINQTNSSVARSARSVDGVKLTINLTLDSASQIGIVIVAVDSKGLQSIIKLDIIVCTGCHKHGTCDFTNKQNISSLYFSLAKCQCDSPWSGENCERDKNGCASIPCPILTTCTDVPAGEEASGAVAYRCSSCPVGTVLSSNGTKCVDLNECLTGSNPCTNAECINTIGSFQCNCTPGYRRSSPSVCVDINECSEMKHSCPQKCINTPGFYDCECEEGFTKSGVLGFQCNKDSDPCSNVTHNCSYGCQVVSGLPKCFCEHGKQLTANGSSCEDIDECQLKLCSQQCNNTDGGYHCYCNPGYFMGDDDQSCFPCTGNSFGLKCSHKCECRGSEHSKQCSNVRGCICLDNWSGTNCDVDVNECNTIPNICRPEEKCVNTPGSYRCECYTGYKNISGTCQNINECLSPSENVCSQMCVDNKGSYTCACYDGYVPVSSSGKCQDINECAQGTSGCEHLCVNKDGSFVCQCRLGYTLTEDRRTCIVGFKPCRELNTSCSFGCDIVNGEANCYCPIGFQLGTDGMSCVDINECTMNKSQCQQTCINKNGSYDCSCLPGQQLLSDQRTCLACDQYHWGNNCKEQCNCSTKGTKVCDPFNGCQCVDGWSGKHCDKDVDECSFDKSPCGRMQNCINIAGSYLCTCYAGLTLVNETCVDLDECSMYSPCDYACNNTFGSYFCSCDSGFTLDDSGCVDIDECAIPKLSQCDQSCRNTEGAFACECYNGYVLNTTTRNTCYSDPLAHACNGSKNCSYTCVVETGFEVCKCRPGFFLDPADNTTCQDKDECVGGPSPCVNGLCQNLPGSFQCSCSNGSRLAADGVTCQECGFGFYGSNCTNACSCNKTTTDKCLATNGFCVCHQGWTGSTCSQDVNECSGNNTIRCGSNAVCVNSQGSYKCVCNVGFFRAENECHECDSSHFGQDCRQICDCFSENVEDCVDATGDCICRNGSHGALCDVDVNECLDTSTCSGLHEQCENYNFTYKCLCEDGYTRFDTSKNCTDINECLNPSIKTCEEPKVCRNTVPGYACDCRQGYVESGSTCVVKFKAYAVQITLVFANDQTDPRLFDNTTSQFQELAEQVEKALLDSGRRFINDALLSVTVNYFSLGSVISYTVLKIDERYSKNPDGDVSKLLMSYLKSPRVQVGDTTANITKISIMNVILTKDSTVCQVHEAIIKCRTNEKCQEVNRTPECRAVSGVSIDLILGLSIGIPLFVLSIIVIVVLIVYYIRRKNRLAKASSTPSYDGSVFADNMATRSSWSVAEPYPKYSTPDYLNSSQGGGEYRNLLHNHPQQHPDTSIREAASENYQEDGDSERTLKNISFWMKMSDLLVPYKDLQIQRPHITLSSDQRQFVEGERTNTHTDEEHVELRPGQEHINRRPDSQA